MQELREEYRDLSRILFTQEEIAARVKEIGEEISRTCAGQELFMVCILKGACVFFADLMRAITIPVRIGFMSASSYGAGVFSSGEVKLGGLSFPVEGKNILIVEDIIDTGNSLCALKRFLTERGAASVKICAFLDKESRRTADVAVDFVGYTIEDEFVVGYGLDYAERYRGLPYIGILKREVYEK